MFTYTLIIYCLRSFSLAANDCISAIQKSEPLQMTEKEIDIINRLGTYIHENGMSNEALVQLIELSGSFLNLMTISDYAKANQLSYNGVKHNRTIVKIFNTKFVIENQ